MKKLLAIAGTAALALGATFVGATAAQAAPTPGSSLNFDKRQFTPGEQVTVSNGAGGECISDDGYVVGDVTIEFNGKLLAVDVQSDGSWSQVLNTPTTPGKYPLAVTCDLYYTDAIPYAAYEVEVPGSSGTSGVTGSGSYSPLSDEQLVDANAASVSVVQISGRDVTVSVGADWAGKTVAGFVYTEPTFAGTAVVDASGNAMFSIPASIGAGTHKLAVYDASNSNLIGWVYIIVNADGSISVGGVKGALASTGGSPMAMIGTAGLMLAAAAGAVFVARRRQGLSVSA